MDNLEALSAGYRQVGNQGRTAQASLIAAVASAEPAQQLVQVAPPVNYASINVSQLSENVDDIYQVTVRNETGATQTVFFGGLFSLPGQNQFYGFPPSAVDFATFTEPGFAFPANGGSIKGANNRFNIMPAVVSRFVIQTPSATQANQKLTVGQLTKSLNKQETALYPGICDACYNNNTVINTREWVRPFGLGKNSYLAYPILQYLGSNDVTIRMEFAGEAAVSGMTQEMM